MISRTLEQLEFAALVAALPRLIVAAKKRAARPPVGGVSARLLIQRKFRRRWSDLELLILLEIGVGEASYVQLVDNTGASTSGVWNSLQNHLLPDEMVTATKAAGRTIYRLTPKGQAELYKVLR